MKLVSWCNRYASRSCPLCIKQTAEIESMLEGLIQSLRLQNSTNPDVGAELRNVDALERAEDFQHLIMIGMYVY